MPFAAKCFDLLSGAGTRQAGGHWFEPSTAHVSQAARLSQNALSGRKEEAPFPGPLVRCGRVADELDLGASPLGERVEMRAGLPAHRCPTVPLQLKESSDLTTPDPR